MDVIDLSTSALPVLADRGLAVPQYDREALVPRIVHIGVGGFHRSHLAMYVDRLASGGADWAICGLCLLPGDAAIVDALRAQDHLYTLTTKTAAARSSTVIGSIVDVVHAPNEDEPAVERLARPDTAIVSLTVTEAGYDDTDRNRRTFDLIAAAIERRLDRGLSGVTVLSCDNLPGNGDAARRCVLAACDRRSPGLAARVEVSCTFPNSMVDRITPVTADGDRRALLDDFGLRDRWPVVAEPFCQWVVEDRFAAGRPDIASVGAILSDDVHAWERYKLRLLNAAHSAIAYLAALVPYTYVDEVLADPDFANFLERLLLDEAVPSLDPIDGHPPEDYVATVLDRFANAGVRDQIARLCVDGTAKMPRFLFPIVSDRLANGGSVDRCATAVAGWARYLAIVPEADQAPDAAADRVRRLASAAREDPVAFVDERAGFPPDLAASAEFREAFADAFRRLDAGGPRAAIG